MTVLKKPLTRQPQLPRFLCHIFQRLQQKRLNLVTGAGISIDAGVPSWHGLLDRLAERSEELKADLQQHRKSGLNPEYLGQIIYHRHRSEYSKSPPIYVRPRSITAGRNRYTKRSISRCQTASTLWSKITIIWLSSGI